MKAAEQKKLLFNLVPIGQITTRRYLLSQNFTGHSLDNYLKSSQLRLVVKGVYCRSEGEISWQGVVASLPQLLSRPVVVGGLTALEIHGYAQYLNLGDVRHVHLYSPEYCPNWVKKVIEALDGVKLCWHSTGRLWRKGWPEKPMIKDYLWREGSTVMQLSLVEQAVLEMLMTVPEQTSVEHANELIQGMTSLSPNRLSSLLLACKNVKVKRLFFWHADRYTYPWREVLNEEDYDLGKGKRVVFKGGKLDKHYMITVPTNLAREE